MQTKRAERHTPGPWVWTSPYCLRPANPSPSESAVHTIMNDHGGAGFIASDVHATLAELDADRRLIAAAPDMLEVLRRALAHIAAARARPAGRGIDQRDGGWRDDAADGFDALADDRLLDTLRTVIEHATGAEA